MPAFLTHCIFAEEVFESIDFDRIGASNIKSELQSRNPLYLLGAQGPDIFFYYKARPWQKNDGLGELGMMMHDTIVSGFFSESAEYIKVFLKAGSRFYSILSYMLGYVCHFSLDKNAHPFIHYYSGIDTNKDRTTHKYFNYHKKYEAILDAYMWKKSRGTDANKSRASELIDTGGKYNETLKSFYFYIINRIYKFGINERQVEIALYDTAKLLNEFRDPTGAKSVFFRALESIFGKKGDITSLLYPKNLEEFGDFLNLEKRTWPHPCNEKLAFNTSFPEIYSAAKNEASRLAEDYIMYATGRVTKMDFNSGFGFSYATGSGFGTIPALKYYDCIFEKNPQVNIL